MFKTSEVIATAEGRQYHIGLAPGEVAPYILLCGDTGRVHKVAGYFDEAGEPVSNREYTTITGKYKGIPISVMATGMGPDNTEMAIVELSNIIKNPTLIRVGTSGGLRKEIKNGDVVISSGAVRLENTSLSYVIEGYPSVAHHEVVLALLESARAEKARYHLGLTATAPGFYGAEGRTTPVFKSRTPNLSEELDNMNVSNMEMEASTLFTMSTLAGYRAGAVCAIIAERHAGKFIDDEGMKKVQLDAIKVALGAVEVLAKMDALKGKGKFWLPSMGL